jgi:hypothetical protein
MRRLLSALFSAVRSVVYIDDTPTREEEIPWAAGIFEGEGCVTEVDGRFTLKVNNTDPEVIRRFDEVVQFGRVYGPYRNSERDGHRRKPFWAWVASGYDALDVMNMLAPWLTVRRLARAQTLTGLSFPVQTPPL